MRLFDLNPDLDASALAKAFERDGRLQIRNFLAAPDAARLSVSLNALDWRLVLNNGPRHVDLQREQIAEGGQARMQSITDEVGKRAAQGFQYLYQNYPVADLAEAGVLAHDELKTAFATMNAKPAIALLQAITGHKAEFCDMQATRYGPGHFLTVHNDHEPSKHRLFAYVLGLTKNWPPTWGGQLQFLDVETGSVIESYVPVFNSLSILRVPQPHHVSQVASFASSGRISLTGWYRLRS